MTITFPKNSIKSLAISIAMALVIIAIFTGVAQQYIYFAGVENEIGTIVMCFILFSVTFYDVIKSIKIKLD